MNLPLMRRWYSDVEQGKIDDSMGCTSTITVQYGRQANRYEMHFFVILSDVCFQDNNETSFRHLSV